MMLKSRSSQKDVDIQRFLVFPFSSVTKRKLLLYLISASMMSLFVVFTFVRPAEKNEDLKWEYAACRSYAESRSSGKSQSGNKTYLITWYNMSPYIRLRKDAWQRDFKMCKYSNCELSLCKGTAQQSQAVIFNGRRLPKVYSYTRPFDQVWIFAEDESPLTYDYDGGHWRSEFWRHAFNWTMTYDLNKADIYLPSGELWSKALKDDRNFLEIAKKKSNSALIVTSHCTTESKRTEYVVELQKYVDVDILGTCGRKWDCGKAWFHDDCFSILNTSYKFYLAFENAMCHAYRTEKFFENYNYDIVMVARGGLGNDDVILPREAYISTSDFSSVEQLGKYLQRLSTNTEEYADLLKKKSQYYVPDYGNIYQRALCDICEKMNHQDKNHRIIPDMVEHINTEQACSKPTDIIVKKHSPIISWLWRKW